MFNFRVLDDNQELFIPQTEEILRPAPGFRIFATQNPSSYSGRSLLSKAFRNRFVLMSFDNLSYTDLKQILRIRCSLPDSRAKLLIKILKKLRLLRSSEQVFQGKEGLVTVRDFLKLGQRRIEGTKEDLALETFSLLGERVRQRGMKKEILKLVQQETGTLAKVEDFHELVLSEVGRLGLQGFFDDPDFYENRMKSKEEGQSGGKYLEAFLESSKIERTQELDRCMALMFRALKSKEPVLLVGETGCGKTTLAQAMADLLNLKFTALNCHKNTEVSDFLGSFRPVRDHEENIQIARTWITKRVQNKIVSDLNLIKLAESFVQFVEDFSWKIKNLEKEQWNLIRETFQELKNSREKEADWKNTVQQILDSIVPNAQIKNEEIALSVNVSEFLGNFQLISSMLKIPKKFEWVDGSLVKAVRNGGVFLVDEISLASDNVLERLNSLLESQRSLFMEKSENIWTRGKALWDLLEVESQANTIIRESNLPIFF